MSGKTIIIKNAVQYCGLIRVVVTECPSCGRRLITGMTKCPVCNLIISSKQEY